MVVSSHQKHRQYIYAQYFLDTVWPCFNDRPVRIEIFDGDALGAAVGTVRWDAGEGRFHVKATWAQDSSAFLQTLFHELGHVHLGLLGQGGAGAVEKTIDDWAWGMLDHWGQPMAKALMGEPEDLDRLVQRTDTPAGRAVKAIIETSAQAAERLPHHKALGGGSLKAICSRYGASFGLTGLATRAIGFEKSIPVGIDVTDIDQADLSDWQKDVLKRHRMYVSFLAELKANGIID